jgi:hypothetical protein
MKSDVNKKAPKNFEFPYMHGGFKHISTPSGKGWGRINILYDVLKRR